MSTIPEGAVAQYAATDGQGRRKRVTRQGGAARSPKPAKATYDVSSCLGQQLRRGLPTAWRLGHGVISFTERI